MVSWCNLDPDPQHFIQPITIFFISPFPNFLFGPLKSLFWIYYAYVIIHITTFMFGNKNSHKKPWRSTVFQPQKILGVPLLLPPPPEKNPWRKLIDLLRFVINPLNFLKFKFLLHPPWCRSNYWKLLRNYVPLFIRIFCQITEAKLRSTFSAKGAITDLQLKYTKGRAS